MKNFEVENGTYIPDMGLTYDEHDPYIRMYKPVYDRVCKVDEHYPFVDDSLRHRWNQFWAYPVVLYGLVGGLLFTRHGLRIHGREKLAKYKKELAGGYISIANHMHPHDCEAVLIALRSKRTTKIPMFQKNFETKNQVFLKWVGGIPIPPVEEGLSAMKQFNAAFDEFHKRGYCLHIFPEMSKWPWYTPLRPFQKGAFTMAYKYGMPIIPCVISYRPRTGLYKLFGPANEPLIDVTIGEPIFPDKSKPRKEEVDNLRDRAHADMLQMMHITTNPWPAAPENE